MQRIHKVLGLAQERVKGRMLQQGGTFSAVRTHSGPLVPAFGVDHLAPTWLVSTCTDRPAIAVAFDREEQEAGVPGQQEACRSPTSSQPARLAAP